VVVHPHWAPIRKRYIFESRAGEMKLKHLILINAIICISKSMNHFVDNVMTRALVSRKGGGEHTQDRDSDPKGGTG
jgi:hypothetical protein